MARFWRTPKLTVRASTWVLVRYILPFRECQPVGVGNPNRILDSQMNASSYTSRYLPYYGRLDEKRGAGAWSKNRADYLQADLGTEHSVCAVATQGSFLYHEWLTSYILLMSKDGVTWGTYKENNAAEKVR